MTDEVLSCPNCRARVFVEWTECKFCGAALGDRSLGVAVDPDDLVSPAAGDLVPGDSDAGWERGWSPTMNVGTPSDDPGVGAGLHGFDAPGGGAPEPPSGPVTAAPWATDPGEAPGQVPTGGVQPADGDPWAPGASPPSDDPPPGWESTGGSGDWDSGDSGWSSGTTETDSWWSSPDDAVSTEPVGPAGPGPLVPVDDAEPTWVPGPAPSVGGDGPAGDVTAADSWGTTGLDPVEWYTEPVAPPAGGPEPPQGPGGAEPAAVGPEPFDADAIFTEPEVGEFDGVGQDLEPAPETGEIALHWQPASPDAWDAPVDPRGKPKGQPVLSREAKLLLVGLIVVIAVGGAAIWFKDRAPAKSTEWSAEVQDVANWVAEKRELEFTGKVPTETLSPADYDARVESVALPEKESVRQDLTDQVAMWRALGAVEGNPESRIDWVGAQAPGGGAFYDLSSRTLVVRSGVDIDDDGPTIAGALSVALDDQHVDLSSLQELGIAQDPTFDMVMGMAALMRRTYIDDNTDGEAGVGGELRALSESEGTGEDLDFFTARVVMRVGLGDGFVRFIRALEGTDAGNQLVNSPPASSQQVMFPLTYLSGRGTLVVPAPEIPEGVETVDEGTLGASTWYLLLAARTADSAALDDVLDFAQRWAGDHYIAYRDGENRLCVSDVLRGADESDLRVLTSQLEQWSDAVPDDRVEVVPAGDLGVMVTACDPGPTAEQSLSGSYGHSVLRVIVRSQLAAAYYAEGVEVDNGPNPPIFTPEVAWCIADTAVQGVNSLNLWVLAGQEGPRYQAATINAGRSCGSHLVDQLFADPAG